MLLSSHVSGDPHAEAIVLLHGITQDHRAWDPLGGRISQNNRVVALDLRGHGTSPDQPPYDVLTMAQDVTETLTHLQVRRPLLVGHSLGGVVAVAASLSTSSRGVVVVDQELTIDSLQDSLRPIWPRLHANRADEFLDAVRDLFAPGLHPLPAAEQSRLATISVPKPHIVLEVWQSAAEGSAPEVNTAISALASAVSVPLLSIHGQQPRPTYHQWLSSHVAQVSIETWHRHGHYPHLVDTDRFVTRISQFLEATGSATVRTEQEQPR
jgi:pimeloyl-ACP methyl ester carboxylesterase